MVELVSAANIKENTQSHSEAIKQLALRAADGDRQAFGELVASQYDFIFATAFKWCGNKEDAQDLTQDICVKLARIIKSYDARAAFSTWLYRVVINSVHDMGRSRIRQQKRVEQLKEITISQTLPDQEQSALQNELWVAIRTLPERQRNAMLLVYGEEKTHAQSAQIMNCAETTISGHIFEAKKTLRKLL